MNICIVGVGNIGMRYVQGISRTFPDAKHFLVDNPGRLDELEKLELRNVSFLTSLDELDQFIDLFVVATSCEPRLAIYKRCLQLKPRYIILEKYLFASREEFDECLLLDRVPTFVNQWLYGSRSFDRLFDGEARSAQLVGSGWGLACNAVHWIDVFMRQMNITRLKVGSDTEVSSVFPSKRAGYEEIYGRLTFVDRDSDKSFTLIDEGDDSLVGGQQIIVDGKIYEFDYSHVKLGKEVIADFPYFSDLVGDIVRDIMGKGSCYLPSLDESIAQHLLTEEIFATLDRRPNVT